MSPIEDGIGGKLGSLEGSAPVTAIAEEACTSRLASLRACLLLQEDLEPAS